MQSRAVFWRRGYISAAVLVGFLLLLVAGDRVAQAAESGGTGGKEEITLSPAVEQLGAEPGQTKSGKFTVLNTGEKDFSFIVYARPYSVETEQYSPNYQDTPPRSDLYRWVQFDVTEGKLAPGEKSEISYTVRVPDDVEAGGHYGVLFAETVADESGDQVIARNKRVGTVVRMTVGGDIRRGANIESQTIRWLQTRPPLEAEALIDNTGNIDFEAETELRVTTIFGRELYNSKSSHVVYPDKPRQITTAWEDSSVIGLYRVEQSISIFDGDETVESGYVLVAPRWALILVAVALLSGGVYAAYRRLR